MIRVFRRNVSYGFGKTFSILLRYWRKAWSILFRRKQILSITQTSHNKKKEQKDNQTQTFVILKKVDKRISNVRIPDEIIISILEFYTPYLVLTKFCFINKRVNSLCNSDYLWRFFSEQHFPSHEKKVKKIRKKKKDAKTWKRVYYYLKKSCYKFNSKRKKYRNKIRFSNEFKTCSNLEFGNLTVAFKKPLKQKGKHSLKFGFRPQKGHKNFTGMLIGICDVDKFDIERYNMWLGSNDSSWSLYLDNGTLRHKSKTRNYLNKKCRIKPGDVITMIVDFEHTRNKKNFWDDDMLGVPRGGASISYKLNNIDMGIAFENVNGKKLVPAVTLECKGQSFSIL